MKLLNLGCGQRFHEDWVNLDFVSSHKDVIQHDLRKGIPFEDESFNVVYHSHVLEHFSKADGINFLKECYRVLQDEGIIRIAVPNLEVIAKEYLKYLELALDGNTDAEANYEWIKLELFDQMVRSRSGGEMLNYLTQKTITNEDYVFHRIGEEGKKIRKACLQKTDLIEQHKTNVQINSHSPLKKKLKKLIKKIVIPFLKKTESNNSEKYKREVEIGSFRLGGEIHQWMYDRYSLKKLLNEVGFENIEVKTAGSSKINNWERFELDATIEGSVFKPDSLYMEGVKSKYY